MHRFVPLTALEHDAQAVIAVDLDASVQLCNRAARRMLGRPGPSSEKCWTFASFRTLDGKPFCGPDCPVQEAARAGHSGAQHWVVPTRGRDAGRPVEVISFLLPWDGSARRAVLHFLRAASVAAETHPWLPTLVLEAAGSISARESEVLRLLAEGRSTCAIAEGLGIATNTVRNHLSSIFHKLAVHGRVEALATFRRTVAGTSDPEPS